VALTPDATSTTGVHGSLGCGVVGLAPTQTNDGYWPAETNSGSLRDGDAANLATWPTSI